jgi:hypothetical protein
MRIIYATGDPGALEFAITDSREAISSNAIVFAVCSEERSLTIQDEDLLDTMIEGERKTFQILLRTVREMEMRRLPCGSPFGSGAEFPTCTTSYVAPIAISNPR